MRFLFFYMMITKQQKIFVIAVLLLIFIGIKMLMINWWQQQQNPIQDILPKNCPTTTTGCQFLGANLRLHNFIDHKHPFAVSIHHLPENVQHVSLSFAMRNMDMGFNRFDLKPQKNGDWYLDNIHLPLCSQTRHDWLIRWQIDQHSYQAEFQTP